MRMIWGARMAPRRAAMLEVEWAMLRMGVGKSSALISPFTTHTGLSIAAAKSVVKRWATDSSSASPSPTSPASRANSTAPTKTKARSMRSSHSVWIAFRPAASTPASRASYHLS